MSFKSFIVSVLINYVFYVFRDLKIENLLLDEDNNIKLIGKTFYNYSNN